MITQFNKNFLFFLFIFYPFVCLANEDIANAENWLNNISSMTADFIQVSSDGGSAQGKIFIKKPFIMSKNLLKGFKPNASGKGAGNPLCCIILNPA